MFFKDSTANKVFLTADVVKISNAEYIYPWLEMKKTFGMYSIVLRLTAQRRRRLLSTQRMNIVLEIVKVEATAACSITNNTIM